MRPRVLLPLLMFAVLLPVGAFSQPEPGAPEVPRFEAVAETQLLMDGLTAPNFRALSELLGEEPKEQEAWTFARGQALLIAETGNLLLLRPPRVQGRDEWFRQAMELRGTSVELARNLAARDYLRSRASLVRVANVCNRCHRTFRVATQVTPFGEP